MEGTLRHDVLRTFFSQRWHRFWGMAMQDYGLGLRVGLKDLPTSGACA